MSLNSQGSFSRGAPLVSRQQRGYFLRDCWRFLWQDKGLFLAWVSASLCSCLAYFCCAALAVVIFFISSNNILNIDTTNQGARILQLAHAFGLSHRADLILLVILAVLALYFVYFLNGALTYVFMQRLQGKSCSLLQGVQRASACKWQVLQWMLLSITLHRIVVFLERQHRILASIFAMLVACGWSLAGFFMLPIIMEKKVGPLMAFKISGQCFRENFRRTVSFGLVLSLISLGVFIGWVYMLWHVSALMAVMSVSNVVFLQLVVLALVILWVMTVKALRFIAASALYLQRTQKHPLAAMPSLA